MLKELKFISQLTAVMAYTVLQSVHALTSAARQPNSSPLSFGQAYETIFLNRPAAQDPLEMDAVVFQKRTLTLTWTALELLC